MVSLDLRRDRVEFRAAAKQLEYDPSTCEAGAITLLRLDQLKLELFPMYMDTPMEGALMTWTSESTEEVVCQKGA